MFSVEVDINRPRQVEVAVEVLRFNQILDGMDMRRLKSRELRRRFQTEQIGVLGHVEVCVWLNMTAVPAGCTRADTSGFEENDGRGFGIVFEEVVCSSHAGEASTDDEDVASLREIWRAAVAVK